MTALKRKILIIGGGPAGLSTAIYSARAGLEPIVFAGSPPGGQLMLTSEVENFPGYKSILGADLIETLRTQAESFGTEIINENITSVEFSKKLVVTTSKSSYQSEVVIITTGAQAIWLGLESETRLRGRGVSACATCDGFFFRDKLVAVVGGGDTAMEEAQTLTKFAKKVYLIHRRDSFRASKIMQERVLNNPKIKVIWNASITEILGEQKVEGVIVRIQNSEGRRQTTEDKRLPLDGVFVAIGYKPDTKLFQNAIQLDEKGYIVTSGVAAIEIAQNIPHPDGHPLPEGGSIDRRMFDYKYQSMTSVSGVFAAGDCVDHAYRQAGTAAGMGIAAALDAQRWLEAKK